MSKGVNNVTVLGYVGRAPEVKATQSGALVATFSLATNEKRKKDDQWVDATEWHNIVAFGKLAEVIREFVRKGSHLYISGRLRTVSWDDKSGVKRYRTAIHADEIILLDSKENGAFSEPPTDAYAGDF